MRVFQLSDRASIVQYNIEKNIENIDMKQIARHYYRPENDKLCYDVFCTSFVVVYERYTTSHDRRVSNVDLCGVYYACFTNHGTIILGDMLPWPYGLIMTCRKRGVGNPRRTPTGSALLFLTESTSRLIYS